MASKKHLSGSVADVGTWPVALLPARSSCRTLIGINQSQWASPLSEDPLCWKLLQGHAHNRPILHCQGVFLVTAIPHVGLRGLVQT